MVSGIFGLTGAGKSTFLAWCADRAQRGKRLRIGFQAAGGVDLSDIRRYDRIYSNFPLLGCYPLDWDSLGVWDYHDCLILIDEIMMLADSRAWKTYPENVKYFFSHHRHYNTDCVFCSQSYKDCDIRIRNLAAQYLYIKAAGAFTEVVPVHHLMDVRGGQIDDWYETGGFLARRFIRRKRLYHMFDSHSRRCLEPVPDTLTLWEVNDGNDAPAITTAATKSLSTPKPTLEGASPPSLEIATPSITPDAPLSTSNVNACRSHLRKAP